MKMESEKDLTRGNIGSVPDPLMPHSPTQVHTHISSRHGLGMQEPSSSGSDSGSSMEEDEEESDVSDMVVENSSRFAGLSRERKKSGGSDYQPPSQSSGRSESESEESDSGSGSESGTDNVSNDRSSYSNETPTKPSPNIPRYNQINKSISPLISRSSPMSNSSARSKLSDVTMRSGHSYQLCPPRRTAAQNVNYNKFMGYSSEDSIDVEPTRPFKQGRRKQSDSEFEMSGEAEASASSSDENSYLVDESSDEDFKRRRRKEGRGRNRKKVHVHVYAFFNFLSFIRGVTMVTPPPPSEYLHIQ